MYAELEQVMKGRIERDGGFTYCPRRGFLEGATLKGLGAVGVREVAKP